MSIEDRDWIRDPQPRPFRFGGFTPKWILIAVTAAAFLVQKAVENGSEAGNRFLYSHLALSLQGVLAGDLWQPATYLFLHQGLDHLAGNMIALYLFASILEERLPAARIWLLYLLGGVAGAGGHLLWVVAGFESGRTNVIGASGAVTAVLAFAAFRAPRHPVHLLVLSVPLWAVGALFVGLDLFRAVQQTGGRVAVQAHLGGAAAAAILHFLTRKGSGRRRARREAIEEENVLRPAGPPPPDTDRVDALLERIHASGMGSLSDEEKEFLKRASERYRGRGR